MIKAYKFGLIVTDDDFSDDDQTTGKQQTNENFDETIHGCDDSVSNASDEWHLLDSYLDQNESIDQDENSSMRL